MDLMHKHVISDKYRFVYHEIQKCGTRSMLDYFLFHPKMDYDAERVFCGLQKSLRDGYFHFAFVRNPWARLVSCWLSKVKYYSHPSRKGKPGISHDDITLQITFDEFVDIVCSVPPHKADVHFQDMHLFVTNDTYIGKVEHLEEDFDDILIALGLPKYDLPNVNRVAVKYDWRDYYTPDTYDKIGDRYATDIAMFGYDVST